MQMAQLFYADGCRLCDIVMDQLDHVGARYNAVEVIENEAQDAWVVVETGEEISTAIMKGIPALMSCGVIMIGFQIGSIIGKYREIMLKKAKNVS